MPRGTTGNFGIRYDAQFQNPTGVKRIDFAQSSSRATLSNGSAAFSMSTGELVAADGAWRSPAYLRRDRASPQMLTFNKRRPATFSKRARKINLEELQRRLRTRLRHRCGAQRCARHLWTDHSAQQTVLRRCAYYAPTRGGKRCTGADRLARVVTPARGWVDSTASSRPAPSRAGAPGALLS